MMINGIQFIQALLEANELAVGKDHQFKGRYEAEKTQLSFHLKKMNGNGSQGGKNLEYRYCSIEILC